MIRLIQQYKRKQILKYLQNSSPEKFESVGEKKLYRIIQNAYKTSPAFRNIFDKANVDPHKITSLEDFKTHIPVTNKANYFEKYSYEQLLGRQGRIMKNAMSSSGFTGTFAYGFSSEKAVRNSRLGVDTTLDYWFDISNKKTFLINCAPMGVHVETSLPLAETSVRSDMAIALLKKVSPAFDQTIIVGDPYFLKKIIEEGDEQGVNWEKLQVSLIAAQDWLPESLRVYMASQIGINTYNNGERGIFATMGMTELGLNVFHESKYTIRIRRTIIKDMDLRNQICGSDTAVAPCIFHYYPFLTFIESLGNEDQQELIFTATDPKGILSIIRYSTGDTGKTISYNQLKSILTPKHQSILPDLKLPVGILYGRTKNRLIYGNKFLHVNDLKEGLFCDHEVASNVTGLLKLEEKQDNMSVLVHLKNGIQPDQNLKKKIHSAIHTYLPFEIRVKLMRYGEFPGAVELNYEKKLGF